MDPNRGLRSLEGTFQNGDHAADFTCQRSTLKALYCTVQFVKEIDNEEKTSLSQKASTHYIQIFLFTRKYSFSSYSLCSKVQRLNNNRLYSLPISSLYFFKLKKSYVPGINRAHLPSGYVKTYYVS